MAILNAPPTFLGAYVVSASLNLGWGGETSSCSLKVVEDPVNGIYFNKAKVKLGTPCKFKFGAMEFIGILQKTSYSESVESGRTYDVLLESPSKIMDGVYIVLNKFQGTTYKTDDPAKLSHPWDNEKMTYGGSNPTNVINVFAHKENYSYNAQTGGHFGGADTNELGYPLSNIVQDIYTTMSKGIFGGKIYYAQAKYDLDLDALGEVLAGIGDYRTSTDFPSLHALITDICDVGMYDFAYTITGDTKEGSDVVTENLKIKLMVMSRKYAPDPDAISTYINTLKNVPDKDKKLASYSIGKELADVDTQKIMIGDAATRYFLADYTNIFPIWGTVGTGANTTYYLDYESAVFRYDVTNPARLYQPITAVVDGGSQGNFTVITTNLLEIRCAMSGRKAWSAYHVFAAKAGGPWEVAGNNWLGGESNLFLFSRLLQGEAIPTDLTETSLEVGAASAAMATFPYAELNPERKEVQLSDLFATLAPQAKLGLLLKQAAIEARFKAVQAVGQDAYGKKFMVMLPGEPGGLSNNWRWIMQDVKAEELWTVEQSGWMGELLKKNFPDMTFYNSDGTLESVAVYPNQKNLDFSSIGNKYSAVYLGAYGNSIGVPAEINTELGTNWIEFKGTDVFGNPTSDVKGFTCVQVQGIPWIDDITTHSNGWNMLARVMLGQEIYNGYHTMFGFENLDFGIGPAMMAPTYLGVPQKSTRYVWGPWFNFDTVQGGNGVDGQYGKTKVYENTEMKPQTFGSVDLMNKYADYLVKSDMAQVHEVESGNVTIADLPSGNLGERMEKNGPYITGMSINIGVNGVETTYEFHTWTKTFAKIAQYNVNRLMSHNKNIMSFYKRLRELIKNPPIKSMNYKLLGQLEKYNITNPNKAPSMQTVAMFLSNYDSSGKNKSVGGAAAHIHAAVQQAANKWEQTYVASMESIMSPIALPNQWS